MIPSVAKVAIWAGIVILLSPAIPWLLVNFELVKEIDFGDIFFWAFISTPFGVALLAFGNARHKKLSKAIYRGKTSLLERFGKWVMWVGILALVSPALVVLLGLAFGASGIPLLQELALGSGFLAAYLVQTASTTGLALIVVGAIVQFWAHRKSKSTEDHT